MRFVLEWLLDQRSTVAGGAAIVIFAVTLILRYGYDLWWPWGIMMATGLGVVAMITAGSE